MPTMADVSPALANFLAEFKRTSSAIVDSYFVVDTERRMVDYNRAFHSMLPRNVARNLNGKRCYDVLQLNICKDACIAKQCWQTERHIRLDEITGTIVRDADGETDPPRLRFILSAVPITDENGTPVGALEIQRTVTDEATIQVKYQELLDIEARERERLSQQLRGRTKELLETNQQLQQTQRELLAYRKGVAG